MTHVAFLNDVIPVSGGAERLLVESLLALDPDRFERTLFVTRWDPAVARSSEGAAVLARLAYAGVRICGTQRRGAISPRAWAAVARRLQREQVDVLHSHKFGANVAAAVLCAATGVPLIAHEHGLRTVPSRTRALADRHLIARAASLVLCVSEPDYERLVAVEKLPPEKVRYLPLGAAPPHLPPRSRAHVRHELGLEDDRIVIIAVAELRPEKRHDLLLGALAELTHPHAMLLIAGDGPERASLESQADDLAVAHRVRLLGRRSDVSHLLAAADVGVLSSEREGSPLALMEYMQAGLAIVATRVGGIPALVSHEREALLVPAGAPDALASALQRLCFDAELRDRLGAAARDRFALERGIERYVHGLEEIYAAGASRPQHRPRRSGAAC